MKDLKYILIFILSLVFCSPVSAQNLTEAQKESLQNRVKNKVDEFQFYLGQLANKRKTSMQVKQNAYDSAMKLFIGEGNNYTVYDPDLGRTVEKSAVRMEVSSKYRSTKTRTLMTRYLQNLMNNTRYTQIEITDVDVVRVDNIQQVGDHYECMATFHQKFIGYRDNRKVYSDITTKRIRVYIKAIQIPKSDGSTQVIWNAFLGDIYVLDTTPER